jgi:hypothetical protein
MHTLKEKRKKKTRKIVGSFNHLDEKLVMVNPLAKNLCM